MNGIANRPTRENRKIQDWERFKQFVKQHEEKTQQQMVDLWGENLTQQNVSDGIKNLGITRKKLTDTKKEMKKKEENFKKKSRKNNQII